MPSGRVGGQLDCHGAGWPAAQFRLSDRNGLWNRLRNVLVPGQSQKLGIKIKTIDGAPRPFWLNNAAGIQPAMQTWVDGVIRAALLPSPIPRLAASR